MDQQRRFDTRRVGVGEKLQLAHEILEKSLWTSRPGSRPSGSAP